ncbi:MAG: 30S ribosomal protein S4, small subunit ribosomal protein S4 [Candidatus Peregrinibacteria bacterium GW2011_GWC2_39_14]|nr:MAG: 30S ribosomal protein S4 [Candidatus Peregrinibacteria bacterium GW2011_GWA2_38_36]KKR06839.1 MAG: 30S ribosomal protein S4, small subunit ribosomal protein S4 [Candidatus Peregrinibacteria bacterium GW2011_GWC2_39_14]
MSKLTTRPVCRLCRREGEKLFLKGARCESQKCALVKKNYAPGQHGPLAKKGRGKSEYGRQMREKQKAKRIFGLNERQFHNYYKVAVKTEGVTGIAFLNLLEKRLDNVIYRAGFATSRAQARQIVNHGLCHINGKKVATASYGVKVGEKFEIKEKLRGSKLFETAKASKFNPPKWIKVDLKSLTGEIVAEPDKDDFEKSIQTNIIIEYYSK